MLDVSFGHLGNMHQPVLMDADIDKCAEINNVAHRTLQYHARRQVFHLKHIGTKDGFRHLIPGVTRRFLQLFHDILQRQFANFQLGGKFLIVRNLLRDTGEFTTADILGDKSQFLQ